MMIHCIDNGNESTSILPLAVLSDFFQQQFFDAWKCYHSLANVHVHFENLFNSLYCWWKPCRVTAQGIFTEIAQIEFY